MLVEYAKPGTYGLPKGSMVLDKDTNVAAPTVQMMTPGSNVYGGVVTSCAAAETVTIPYAAEETDGAYVMKTTTYVCPSADTYTIVPPSTVEASVSTVMVSLPSLSPN